MKKGNVWEYKLKRDAEKRLSVPKGLQCKGKCPKKHRVPQSSTKTRV
jgi:hypothetical protein